MEITGNGPGSPCCSAAAAQHARASTISCAVAQSAREMLVEVGFDQSRERTEGDQPARLSIGA